MKLRIVFNGKKYLVEKKKFFGWKKLRRVSRCKILTVKQWSVCPVWGITEENCLVELNTYDKALQCANEYIESKKVKRPRIICDEIEI